MNEYENVTISMVYDKLQYRQKKIEEVETILLLPEEKLSKSELKELMEIRGEMLRGKSTSLRELDIGQRQDIYD